MALEYPIFGEPICLLPQKCLFLPSHKMLILADLHLGKATHFRKAGFPVPAAIPVHDLNRLSQAIAQAGEVEQVCFLGDLFHSVYNQEWELLEAWLDQYPHIHFSLVWGNHDVHSRQFLPSRIEAVPSMQIKHLLLTHEPLEAHQADGVYNLCGHVHPAVLLQGKGRQQLRLPCFYFKEKQGILPAFGAFTGNAILPLAQAKAVFAVTEQKIWKVQ